MNHTMEQITVSRPAYIALLLSQGYLKIGKSSCFADVYANPCDRSHVIKVGREGEASRDGWLAYAQWIIGLPDSESSQHFPAIESLDVVRNDAGEPVWFAARVERLSEIEDQTSDVQDSFMTDTWTSQHKLKGNHTVISLPEDLANAITRIRDKFNGKFDFDLHDANAMVRHDVSGPVLVLNDPLSYPAGLY
jgi:hypothetical protein